MATEAQTDRSELHDIQGEKDIFDPTNGHHIGTLIAGPNQLRSGSAKHVYASTFTLVTPDKTRVDFGPTGSYVHAYPRPESEASGRVVTPIQALSNELSWMYQFTTARVPNSALGPRSVVHNLNPHSTTLEIFTEAVAFGESIFDVLYTLDRLPDYLLAESSQKYMALASIARVIAALEEFHSMRIEKDGNVYGVIHRDVGQFGHVSNILLPARGGRAVLIDYELVRAEVEGENLFGRQEWDMHVLINKIVREINDPHNLIQIKRLLPKELQDALNSTEPAYGTFSLENLARLANEQLQAIVETSGETEQQALMRIQHQYFLAFLNDKINFSTQQYLPITSLEAISEGVDEIYNGNIPDAPTQILDATELKGYYNS